MTLEWLELEDMAPGLPLRLPIYRFGDPTATPHAYLQAALHADELPSLLVLRHLRRQLQQAEARGEIRGRVTVVPVANPLGLNQLFAGHLIGRFDFHSGRNFNRQFPDAAAALGDVLLPHFTADSAANAAFVEHQVHAWLAAMPVYRPVERLQRALFGLAFAADVVLDLHCDSEALLHLYAAADQADMARQLAEDLGATVVLLESHEPSMPFDAACGGLWRRLHQQCPAVPAKCFATTVELRGQQDVHVDQAAADAAGLWRFLQRQGVIRGESAPLPAPQVQLAPLSGVDLVTAPHPGIVMYRKGLGDWIEAGDAVAELIAPLDDLQRHPTLLVSATAGRLFARRLTRWAQAGDMVAKIAGQTPLAHRLRGPLLGDR